MSSIKIKYPLSKNFRIFFYYYVLFLPLSFSKNRRFFLNCKKTKKLQKKCNKLQKITFNVIELSMIQSALS